MPNPAWRAGLKAVFVGQEVNMPHVLTLPISFSWLFKSLGAHWPGTVLGFGYRSGLEGEVPALLVLTL